MRHSFSLLYYYIIIIVVCFALNVFVLSFSEYLLPYKLPCSYLEPTVVVNIVINYYNLSTLRENILFQLFLQFHADSWRVM